MWYLYMLLKYIRWNITSIYCYREKFLSGPSINPVFPIFFALTTHDLYKLAGWSSLSPIFSLADPDPLWSIVSLNFIIAINIILWGFLALSFLWWTGSWPDASTPNLEDQVIFGQGFLPLAFVKPLQGSSICTLDRGHHCLLSVGPAEPRFFYEVVALPPHPFPTWLGTGFGGFSVLDYIR